jgi:hypothetical protein
MRPMLSPPLLLLLSLHHSRTDATGTTTPNTVTVAVDWSTERVVSRTAATVEVSGAG